VTGAHELPGAFMVGPVDARNTAAQDRGGGPGATAQNEQTGIHSAIELVAPLLRRLDSLVGLGVLGGVVGIAAAFVLPPHYRVEASFVPEMSAEIPSLATGGLSSLASRLGVAGGETQSSPDFYAQVLRTRTVLDPVILKKYSSPRVDSPGDSVTLLEILEIPQGRSPEWRLEVAAKTLNDRLDVSIDQASGIVSVSVDMPNGALGVAVVRAMLSQLDSFNLFTRQSSAKSRREFLMSRVAEAHSQLDSIEMTLEHFYATNRILTSSPSLTFQEARLRRRLDMAQAIYVSLTQQLEGAQIDAVRDTPTLTVVERPIAPTKPKWPRKSVLGLLGFAFGMIVGGVRTTWREAVSPDSPLRLSVARAGEALRDLAVRWRRRGRNG